MKLLLLNGHGASITVDKAKIHLRDGRYNTTEEPITYTYAPRRIDVEHIVVYGRSGHITFDAIRWLVKHSVQISILDWNGKLLTTMLPPESIQVRAKQAQYSTNADSKKRIMIARAFLNAKFAHTKLVLDYLKTRYSAINTDFSKELTNYDRAKSISELMTAEGRIASHYWSQITKVLPSTVEFLGRATKNKPRNAGDTVNCLLNYGYSILEAECRKALNTAGLDPYLGFLHEHHTGTVSLAYDLQEPYRFLIDLAVLQLIEAKMLDKNDFVRTENYTLRLRPSGAKKLIKAIDAQLDKTATYRGQQWSWRYIITAKTQELTQHLTGKRITIEFITPNEPLHRQDSEDLRQQILNLNYTEWKKLGYSKGTLHYMKKNAKSDKPFTLNKHVMERLKEQE